MKMHRSAGRCAVCGWLRRAGADRKARRAHRRRRQGGASTTCRSRSPSGSATSRTKASTCEITDFAGGARALQAVVGGSADVVSGAYEHTINMQSQEAALPGVRAAGRGAADRASACRPRSWPQVQVAEGPEGPEDRRVSAPGSTTNMVVNLRAREGRPQADRRRDHRRRAGRAGASRRWTRARSTRSRRPIR